MKKKYCLPVVVLFLLCSFSLAADKPNFLFIIADDCTFRDIGCYGGQAHTPNVDKLATEGIRMKRCFQAAPMCSPTRHCIYTGLYPVKSGAYPNHTFAKEGTKSIVQYLKPLGYRVALSGKRHIGPIEVFPFEYSNAKGDGANPSMEEIDKLFGECAGSDTPFCLMACSNEPHTPWNKGKEYRKLYKSEELKLRPYMVDTPKTRERYINYLAEITYFDNQVGEILAMLDKHKLADNTLVMVVSEQGNSFPFAKWSCYDSGLQSIMVVRWPGKAAKGAESDAMVEYVDIVPTFVEAAGGTPADILDGRSMLDVFAGKTDKHKEYVFGLQTTRGIYNGPRDYPIRSVRSDEYKLIWNIDPEAKFRNTAVNTDWFKSWERKADKGDVHAKAMLERFFTRPEFELYDVVNDPYNMTNLAGQVKYSEVQAKLKRQLDKWMASQGDSGMGTEMAAFEHMLSGNDEFREWKQAQNE